MAEADWKQMNGFIGRKGEMFVDILRDSDS